MVLLYEPAKLETILKVLCILTSEQGLLTPFAGWNHFFDVKQLFLSLTEENKENGKQSRTKTCQKEHLRVTPNR